MITEDQVRRFEADGYLNVGRVISDEEVESLRAGLDEVIAAEQSGGDDSSPEFKFGHQRAAGVKHDRAIHQYVNMWKRHPAYLACIRQPAITACARALLRTPSVRLWHDQIISKPPGDNADFRYHQDFYFWPLSPPTIASCWLALDDATIDNGCMHVIPASHQDPRFQPEARPAELAAAARGEVTERQKMEQWARDHGKPVELRAGEAMFHHCLNWHGTPQNGTDRQRRAFVMIYLAEGVRYHHAQSPNHILVPTITVADGEPLTGEGFPAC